MVVGADGVYDKQVSPCKPTGASNYGSHVPVDMTPSWPCTCVQGPKKIPLNCPEDTTQAADDCAVALCDLINERQLRGSTVLCTSILGICRAPQRVCQHPRPSKDTGCCATVDKSLHADVMCIVTSKTSRVLPPLSTTKADNQGNTTRGAT